MRRHRGVLQEHDCSFYIFGTGIPALKCPVKSTFSPQNREIMTRFARGNHFRSRHTPDSAPPPHAARYQR